MQKEAFGGRPVDTLDRDEWLRRGRAVICVNTACNEIVRFPRYRVTVRCRCGLRYQARAEVTVEMGE